MLPPGIDIEVRISSDPAMDPPLCFIQMALRNLRGGVVRGGSRSSEGGAFAVTNRQDPFIAALKGEDFMVIMNRTDDPAASRLANLITSYQEVVQRDSGDLRNSQRAHHSMYRLAWIWCGAANDLSNSNTSCGTRHPQLRLAHTEVYLRFRSGTHSSCDANDCCDTRMNIRTTHAPAWQPLPTGTAINTAPVPIFGAWSRHHSCLAFEGSKLMLIQTHPVSGDFLWPLPLPKVRTEYDGKWWYPRHELGLDGPDEFGPWGTRPWHASTKHNPSVWGVSRGQNGSGVDAHMSHNLPRKADCTDHKNRTLLVPIMSMYNLNHVTLHAVPTLEHFASLLSESVDILPHYLVYGPKNVTEDHGFHLVLFALGLAKGYIPGDVLRVASKAESLMGHGRCHCFRSIHGGHGESMSVFRVNARESVRRFSAFTRSFAASIGVPMPTPGTKSLPMLFVERVHYSRMIENAFELQAAVRTTDSLRKLVTFVSFDDSPLAEQARIVMQSGALAGVHGQALNWCGFLTGPRRACLEVIGKRWPFQRNEYRLVSSWGGARYFQLAQNSSSGDHGDFRSHGNLTVDPRQVVAKLIEMSNYLGL